MELYFRAFFYGFFAACFALILELIAFGVLPISFFSFLLAPDQAHLAAGVLIGLTLFAFFEESARLLFLDRLLKNGSFNFFGSCRMVTSGATFGLGFAALELFLRSAASGHFLTLSPEALRTAGFHIILSALMFWLMGRLGPQRRALPVILLSALALHALYNITLLLS